MAKVPFAGAVLPRPKAKPPRKAPVRRKRREPNARIAPPASMHNRLLKNTRMAKLQRMAPAGDSLEAMAKATGYSLETVRNKVGHDAALAYDGLRATAKRPAIPAALRDRYNELRELGMTPAEAADTVLKEQSR